MLHRISLPLFSFIFSAFCLSSLSCVFADDLPVEKPDPSQKQEQNVANNRSTRAIATGREEIAMETANERDADIHSRANRMGDWDNKADWRYDRQKFYQGETQPQAYREEHPYGPPGIGYNAGDEFTPPETR